MKTAVMVLCSLSGAAFAGERTVTLDRACVEIDASDALAPADRELSAKVLRQVLEREHQLVVDSGCTETYRLSHERVEEHYVIRVHNSAAKRRMTVPALDELPVKYRKLVRALIDAKQIAATSAATAAARTAAAATTATASEGADPASEGADPAPEAMPIETASLEPAIEPQAFDAPAIDESVVARIEKRNLWYVMIGSRPTGGTGGSLGYRRLFSTVGVDFAMTWLGSGDSMQSASGASFGAEVLKYAPVGTHSRVYGGGGLSLGMRETNKLAYPSDPHYEGGGAHAEATAGLQIGRAQRGPQLMVQADLTLPFYRLGNWSGDKIYAPSFLLTIGVGL